MFIGLPKDKAKALQTKVSITETILLSEKKNTKSNDITIKKSKKITENEKKTYSEPYKFIQIQRRGSVLSERYPGI